MMGTCAQYHGKRMRNNCPSVSLITFTKSRNQSKSKNSPTIMGWNSFINIVDQFHHLIILHIIIIIFTFCNDIVIKFSLDRGSYDHRTHGPQSRYAFPIVTMTLFGSYTACYLNNIPEAVADSVHLPGYLHNFLEIIVGMYPNTHIPWRLQSGQWRRFMIGPYPLAIGVHGSISIGHGGRR